MLHSGDSNLFAPLCHSLPRFQSLLVFIIYVAIKAMVLIHLPDLANFRFKLLNMLVRGLNYICEGYILLVSETISPELHYSTHVLLPKHAFHCCNMDLF